MFTHTVVTGPEFAGRVYGHPSCDRPAWRSDCAVKVNQSECENLKSEMGEKTETWLSRDCHVSNSSPHIYVPRAFSYSSIVT